jgi:hypothetical protein
MLRISIYDSPGEMRLRLEGRLAGPWVREAELCWETTRSTAGSRTTIVDLRDVDFVDCAGEQLLGNMHQHGVTLIATGAMMHQMVLEIAGSAEDAALPGVPRRRKRRLDPCDTVKRESPTGCSNPSG